MSGKAPYGIFDVAVAAKRLLSPHMVRLTFTGAGVVNMATYAPDQRIKLFFPADDGRAPAIPAPPDWYAVYRAAAPKDRVPMRTYTIRDLRAGQGEVDVDFVLHGDAGPASRWALRATAGDAIQIAAPRRDHAGERGGFEWKPPHDAGDVLLIADETALPAAAGIIENLAARQRPPAVQAFIEVPTAADRLDLPDFDGLSVEWLARETATGVAGHGDLMVAAAGKARLPPPAAARGDIPDDFDHDGEILWDRAEAASAPFYAWVAGETGAVSRIRHHLVKERAVDRRLVNLMGYWRLGKVLD